MKPIICVDFDGTIWDGEKVIDGCLSKLSEIEKTHHVMIFSARPTEAERAQMRFTLVKYGVPFNSIGPIKPNAELFLDDKGERFTSWDKVSW